MFYALGRSVKRKLQPRNEYGYKLMHLRANYDTFPERGDDMRRLGLDVGTNSIGWCLVEFDEEHPIGSRIVDIGVRIFSDGRDPKTGASLAVDRRTARGMRRRRDRYLGRRSAFLDNLIRY